MNIILFDKSEIVESRVTLSDERFIHMRDVLKVEKGNSVKVGIIDGKIGTGKVVALDDTKIVLELDCTDNPSKKLPITLVCTLPRPATLKKVLYSAVSLGVGEIHFINANKVEKAYWDSKRHTPEFLRQTIIDALQQCKDTVFPKIHFHRLFKPFCEDELPHLVKDVVFFAHPGGEKLSKHFDHAVIIIGPEGGFTDYEVSLLEHCAEKIDLGSRILRVEHAVTFAIGKLSEHVL